MWRLSPALRRGVGMTAICANLPPQVLRYTMGRSTERTMTAPTTAKRTAPTSGWPPSTCTSAVRGGWLSSLALNGLVVGVIGAKCVARPPEGNNWHCACAPCLCRPAWVMSRPDQALHAILDVVACPFGRYEYRRCGGGRGDCVSRGLEMVSCKSQGDWLGPHE